MKLVECSLVAEFASAHDGEKKIFRKLQLSGSGAQFSNLGNFADVGHTIWSILFITLLKIIARSSLKACLKWILILHMMEVKNSKTIIFRIRGHIFRFGHICRNLVFNLANFALLFYNL